MQELAVGKSVAAKYGGLGLTGPMVSPPGKLFGLLVGMPASGKSCFIQSHPEAFIINTDLSSTTTDEPQACMWPAMDNPTGTPAEPSGKGESPITLDWEKVLKIKGQLIEMAEKGLERPETVVIDSLGTALALVRKYVTKKAGRSEWKEMDGRRAWDDVYEQCIQIATDLRSSGYGFYYTCHIVNSKIPLGDDRYTIRPELTITDNFYKRLFPLFELVAAFECEIGTETVMVETKGPGGKPGPKRPKTIQYKKHNIKVNDESLNGITKCRVVLPDKFEVPKQNGWKFFSDQYTSAM